MHSTHAGQPRVIPAIPLMAAVCGLLLLPVAAILPAQSNAPYDYLQLTSEVITQPDAETGGEAATDPAPASSPTTADALETDNTQLLATIADYQARLNTLLDDAGPFSSGQVELLDSLGDLYQQVGDHTSALASLDQAMQITRIRDGLFSESQYRYLDDIAHIHLALRDYDSADDMEAARYYVAMKNLAEGTEEFSEASLRWADWNTAYFVNEYLYQNHPSRFSISGSYTGSRRDSQSNMRSSALAGSFQPQGVQVYQPQVSVHMQAITSRSSSHLSLETERLNLAEDIYQAQLSGDKLHDPELHRKLAAISYYRNLEASLVYSTQRYTQEPNPVTYDDLAFIARESYRDGQALFQSLIDNLPQDSEEQLRARLELADWHLLFGYQARATNAYAELQAELAKLGWEEDDVASYFHPTPLVPLPTYIIHQFQPTAFNTHSEASGSTSGSVDVRVELDRDGTLRRSEVLDDSEEADRSLYRLLRDHLSTSIFRPVVTDGRTRREDSIYIRFHYAY